MPDLRSGVAVVALGVALLAAGCGGHGRRATSSTAPARPTATAAAAAALPQPSARCGTPDAHATTLRFRARDGVRLDGAIVGSGRLGVVLLHEYPGPMCGWWPYAVALAHHGVHVLLFDFRCLGMSDCGRPRADYVSDTAGAVAALRARGARSIALVGASIGGSVAVAAGAQLHPAAVVDLSGERDPGRFVAGARMNGMRFAPRLRSPVLFAVARDDPYTSVAAMRDVYRAAGSRDKTLRVLAPGSGHGWDMLVDGRGFDAFAARVTAFVTAHPAPGR